MPNTAEFIHNCMTFELLSRATTLKVDFNLFESTLTVKSDTYNKVMKLSLKMIANEYCVSCEEVRLIKHATVKAYIMTVEQANDLLQTAIQHILERKAE